MIRKLVVLRISLLSLSLSSYLKKYELIFLLKINITRYISRNIDFFLKFDLKYGSLKFE